MLTPIKSSDFWSKLRIPKICGEIPRIFVAEHLRAAAANLFSEDPLSTQRLVAAVEPRLGPLGYRRQVLADECFGGESTDKYSVADMVSALVEIGDFVRIAGGAHYPAETRRVNLAPSLWLIASGLPTFALSQKKLNLEIASLARLTVAEPNKVHVQSLGSWLGLKSQDYGRFANEKFHQARTPFNGDVQDWTFYDVLCANWRPLQGIAATKSVALCRFKPNGVPYYQYVIASLSKKIRATSCSSLLEISAYDARRVICGLNINSGKRKEVFFKQDGNWLVTSISNFAVLEFLKVFRAISAEWLVKPDQRTEFWLSQDLQTSLDAILKIFGRKPIFLK